MTALSITPANVAWVSGPIAGDQVAGEAFDAGALLYKSEAGRWWKMQGDGSEIEAGANGLAIALFSADAAGSRGSLALPGAIVALGTGTAGVAYSAGDTAGSIVPVADVGSGDQLTIAGIGIGSNRILVARIFHAGAVLG